ncbi:MAG: hypothetical protein ACXQS2_01010 [Methermicoccaceae archaeon]
MIEVAFAPGAVNADTEIDMPSGSPPIGTIIDAVLFQGHAVDEGGSATYDIAPTSVTATKVDANTITLDTATTAYDLLILRYYPAGMTSEPSSA